MDGKSCSSFSGPGCGCLAQSEQGGESKPEAKVGWVGDEDPIREENTSFLWKPERLGRGEFRRHGTGVDLLN